MKTTTLEDKEWKVEIAEFGPPGIAEWHLMIHVTDSQLDFISQLRAADQALSRATTTVGNRAKIVFKRYFLSDAYNQTDAITALELDYSDYAVSVVQQPPLDGSKVAMWVYLMSDVETRALPSGLYEAGHGAYRHLWNGGAHNLARNSECQTRLLLNEYVMQLAQEGCTLETNCLRTWFFVNDVDNNYAGVVKARNEVFLTQNLTDSTHFIASTGIGGRQANAAVLSQMDCYAIKGIHREQISYLYATDHLNRTSDYGVSFERGTRVDYGDRRHVLISGTASINNRGEIVHPGNVVQQTRHMWKNVEALLHEADCNFNDVIQMIVYLRDTADYDTVNRLFNERFPDVPHVLVWAPVCRPGWLVEMECMAVKEQDRNDFEAL